MAAPGGRSRGSLSYPIEIILRNLVDATAEDAIAIGLEVGVNGLQSLFRKGDEEPPINFINIIIANKVKADGSSFLNPIQNVNIPSSPFTLAPRHTEGADGDDSDLYDLNTCEGHKIKKGDYFPLVRETETRCICRVGGDSGDDPAQGAFQYAWNGLDSRIVEGSISNILGGLWNIEYKIDGKRNEFRVRPADDINIPHNTDTVEVHYSDICGDNIDGTLSGHEIFVVVYFGFNENEIKTFVQRCHDKDMSTEHGQKLAADCKKMLSSHK